MITTSWREKNAERAILGPGSAKRRQTKLSSLHKIVVIHNTKHESVAVTANMMRETVTMMMMMNETNSESELALNGCGGGNGGDEPLRDDNRLTPRARKKIKMKQEKLTEPKSIQLIPAHSNKSTRVMQTTNYVRKPPEPQGAFLNPYTSTRLLLLALCMLVAEAYITSATASFITSDHSNRLDTEPRTGSTDLRHMDHGLANRLSATYRHLTDRQQRKHQQKLQQDQLRYLIARTSLPQLIGRRHYEQPTSQFYKQRHTNHRDNNIIDYSKESSHPNPVQHTSSQQRSRTKERRNPFFDNIHAGVERDLGGFSVGYVDPLIDDDDLDSLDVELADSEDADDVVVDDDVRDNDYDQGDDDEDDDVAEDDEEEADEKMEDENYVAHLNGDRANSIDDQNTILMDEPDLNKDYAKGTSLKRLRLQSKTTKNHQPQFANYYSGSKYLRTGKEDKHSSQSSNQSFIETLTRRPFKGRQHHNEVGPESHEMVTTSVPVHLDDLSRREQLHLHTQKSLPPAPYQSPVVVSISDNSFVSASPVNLEIHSVNGVDDVESPARPEGEATVHYSHIIAGPKNELPSYGRRYWHDSHMASIHMVQEEPNELHRGDINSAIIAILFGIGVTGMLIMIVSIKMRSIRERVAYKGRRRSLVPDTDFLINTIPM